VHGVPFGDINRVQATAFKHRRRTVQTTIQIFPVVIASWQMVERVLRNWFTSQETHTFREAA